MIRHRTILLQPVMPSAMARLLDLLGAPAGERTFADVARAPLAPGAALPAPTPVFPRYVDAT